MEGQGRAAQWVGPRTLRFTVIEMSLSSAPAWLKKQLSFFLFETCPNFLDIGIVRGKVKEGQSGRVVVVVADPSFKLKSFASLLPSMMPFFWRKVELLDDTPVAPAWLTPLFCHNHVCVKRECFGADSAVAQSAPKI